MMHEADTGLLATPSHSFEGLALGKAISSTRPSVADVRNELQRIIKSAAFDASDRNRRFLSYVVEETIEGRGSRIKAYNIATIVFGRDVDFDPQLDPVVRMEAQRLRRSLERFYLTEGRESTVWIFLPKGGYIPEFRSTIMDSSVEPLCAPRPAGDHDRAPTILVTLFDVEGDVSAYQTHESGFSYQLMIGLCRHPQLTVIGTGGGYRHDSLRAGTLSGAREADFVLTGSKAVVFGIMQVKAVLIDARTGKVLWGRSFERAVEPEGLLNARDEIANSIVQALLRPGELPRVERTGSRGNGRKRSRSKP